MASFRSISRPPRLRWFRPWGCALGLLAWAGCGASGFGTDGDPVVHTVAIALGRVPVGGTLTRGVRVATAPLGSDGLGLLHAPADVEAPSEVRPSAGERTRFELHWTPTQVGRLDGAVLYRQSNGGLLKLTLSGQAVEPNGVSAPPDPRCMPGPDGVDPCDDGDPCSRDRCTATGCEHTPLDEGAPCGPLDCAQGHYCQLGACVRVDVSSQADGRPCDDGDPCTSDGTCRGGQCYASEQPRESRVVERLRTFGHAAFGSATDGRVFVFVSPGDIQVATRGSGDDLVLEARLEDDEGASAVRSLGGGRFLLRYGGKFRMLDASTPARPTVRDLPHIAPQAVPHPDGEPVTSVAFAGEYAWGVLGELAVLPTVTSYPNYGTNYHLTVAPLDPEVGLPRAIDIPAYRVEPVGDVVMYTIPYAANRVGLIRFAQDGELLEHHEVDAREAGCEGGPRHLGGHGSFVTTHSDEDGAGFAFVCLWHIDPELPDGFELVAARKLRHHLHGQRVAMDAEHIYLGFGYLYARGWLGEYLGLGEVARFDREWFAGGSESFAYGDGEQVTQFANGSRSRVEAGYLVGARAGSLAIDLDSGFTPLMAPGVGSYHTVLPADEGRFLVAGGAHAAVVELASGLATDDTRLAWGARHHAYPPYDDVGTDARLVRHRGGYVNLTPRLDRVRTKARELTVRRLEVDDDGAIHDRVARVPWLPVLDDEWSATVHWSAVAGGRLWVRYGGYLPLRGFDLADTDAAPLELEVDYTDSGHMQGDPETGMLSVGSPRQVLTFDPLAPPADPLPYYTQVRSASGEGGVMESSRRFVLRGRRLWVDSIGGVGLYQLGEASPLGEVHWDDADPARVVSIVWADTDRALLNYWDTDGESHLVQVLYEDGALHALGALDTEATPVLSAAPYDEGHFVSVSDDGVQRLQLQCWQPSMQGAP